MDIPVYSVAGQVVDQVAVDEAAMGGVPNTELLRQALVQYEANQRVGTAKTKTRGQLTRSDRKPRPQKHTGRSRQGTRNSPIWVGGGVAHGPEPRDYRKKLSKSARRQAVRSAFLAKALDGEVLAIDRLELPAMKTKEMAAVLKNVGADRTVLVVLPEPDAELWRCTRNIAGAAMTSCRELNAYILMRPKRVVFTRDALDQFLSTALDGAAVDQTADEPVGATEDE